MKKYIKYAFSRTLPVLFGYIFLGIAFGIVLQQAGFNFIWAFCISLFLYAGSMQFVLVPLLASAASPLTVAITTLFVNSRHVFYGLSFIESFKKMKTQLYMIFSLSDETYSVLCSCKNEDPEEKNRPAWFLINLFDQSYWIIGSVIGALLGQVLPFDFTCYYCCSGYLLPEGSTDCPRHRNHCSRHRHCRCCHPPSLETQYAVKRGRRNCSVYDFYSMPSIMRLATNTPLADA